MLSSQQQAGWQLVSGWQVSCLALSASLWELHCCFLMRQALSASASWASQACLVCCLCLAPLLSSKRVLQPLSSCCPVLLYLNVVFTGSGACCLLPECVHYWYMYWINIDIDIDIDSSCSRIIALLILDMRNILIFLIWACMKKKWAASCHS